MTSPDYELQMWFDCGADVKAIVFQPRGLLTKAAGSCQFQ
jgi:hypothetical protein